MNFVYIHIILRKICDKYRTYSPQALLSPHNLPRLTPLFSASKLLRHEKSYYSGNYSTTLATTNYHKNKDTESINNCTDTSHLKTNKKRDRNDFSRCKMCSLVVLLQILF